MCMGLIEFKVSQFIIIIVLSMWQICVKTCLSKLSLYIDLIFTLQDINKNCSWNEQTISIYIRKIKTILKGFSFN